MPGSDSRVRHSFVSPGLFWTFFFRLGLGCGSMLRRRRSRMLLQSRALLWLLILRVCHRSRPLFLHRTLRLRRLSFRHRLRVLLRRLSLRRRLLLRMLHGSWMLLLLRHRFLWPRRGSRHRSGLRPPRLLRLRGWLSLACRFIHPWLRLRRRLFRPRSIGSRRRLVAHCHRHRGANVMVCG